MNTLATALAALAFSAGAACAQSSIPDPSRTPGAVDPAVTQENIQQTICVAGYTATVRPPTSYTNAIKHRLFVVAGSPGEVSDFELDHDVPLTLGGAPRDLKNLWLEPWAPSDGWGAGSKDRLEVRLNKMVCAGEIALDDARHVIAADWIAAYRTYVGERSDGGR